MKKEFISLLTHITKNPITHARWLHSLSYMELVGAKKIAGLLNAKTATSERLQHATEEFRHAHHLKRQMEKIGPQNGMLGGFTTLQYLHKLDIDICRLLKRAGFTGLALQERAYLLVTYAIEVRASEIYPLYEEILRKIDSPVSVKSILLEEQGHLEDVEAEIKKVGLAEFLITESISLESRHCSLWVKEIHHEILTA